MERPVIVCLCGSTRFSETFREANLQETLAGKIVLSIGCEWHSDQALGLTEADKERLDALHLEKIKLADEVLFLNVGGYMGLSTLREHFYAHALGKAIRYLEEKPGGYGFYYTLAYDVGMQWLREQQERGKFPDGIEPINRCIWFSEDGLV